MYARALAICLLVAPLTAFAAPEAFQNQMNGWIGRSPQDLLEHFRRVVTYDAKDYRLIADFSSGSMSNKGHEFIQTTTLSFGAADKNGHLIDEACKVTFTIRGGVIGSWRAEGDRCAAEKPIAQVPAQATPPPLVAADEAAFQNQMNSWVGRPELDMYLHFRNRDVIYEEDNYKLVGINGGNATPAPDGGRTGIATLIFGGSDEIPRGGTAPVESCKVTITTHLPTGSSIDHTLVESWRAEGNRCVAEMVGPRPQVSAKTVSPDATTFINQMNGWVGRSAPDLGRHFNRNAVYEGDDYRAIWCSTTDAWETLYFGAHNRPHSNTPSDINESCKVTFTLRSGAIETWRAEGDRCVAEMLGPWPEGTAPAPSPPRDKPPALSDLARDLGKFVRDYALRAILLLAIPSVVTVLCLRWLRRRPGALGFAIVFFVLLGTMLGTMLVGTMAAAPPDYAIFLLFATPLVWWCLLVALVVHVLSFRPRDRTVFAACGLAWLAITVSLFAWSNQWHVRIYLDSIDACQIWPQPTLPVGLKVVDAAKRVLGIPVLWVFGGDLYPFAQFFILATLNSILIAYGFIVTIRAFRE